MAEEKARYSRLLFIDGRIAGGGYPNAVELAREYEVSDRTIKRDIEYLRDVVGAPIGFDRRRNGYYLTEPAWRLASLTISESELLAVTLAADVLEAYRNSPLYEELTRVFAKLAALLPERVTVGVGWLDRRVSVFHTPSSRIGPGTWPAVLECLRDNRVIGFRYTAIGYTTSVERKVDPYHCIAHRGEWYLIGRDRGKDALRVYALSRMESVRVGGEQFEFPDGFDPATVVDRNFGVYLAEESYDVRIRFAPHLAPYIAERTWHETQTPTDLPDGGLELAFTTNQLDAVRYWCGSWGPGVTVLEPELLRTQVVADLTALLAGYRSAEKPMAREPGLR